MPPRRALATFAAVTLGAIAIGAAVGATTRVFNVAEASPGVGRVSPVSTPTLPPVAERRVIDVEDPAPTPAGPQPTSAQTSGVHTEVGSGTDASRAVASSTTAAPPRHENEHHGEDD